MMLVISMRKIPLKNYIIYIIICLLTLFFLFIFVNRIKRTDHSSDSLLNGFLYEIKYDDIFQNLKNYAIDNPNFVLYISNQSQSFFDKELKQYLLENNLKEEIVYLDGWNKLDNDFINEFKEEFFSPSLYIDSDCIKQSNFYTYENGMIVRTLYTTQEKINMDDVRIYLEREDFYD